MLKLLIMLRLPLFVKKTAVQIYCSNLRPRVPNPLILLSRTHFVLVFCQTVPSNSCYRCAIRIIFESSRIF